MKYTVAIQNSDTTARIVGFEDRDLEANWEPSPGYVYLEGQFDDKKFYAVLHDAEWIATPRPEFNQYDAVISLAVGEKKVFDLGETGAEVYLQSESLGINDESEIEFVAENAGCYRLECRKFPFQDWKVIINAY